MNEKTTSNTKNKQKSMSGANVKRNTAKLAERLKQNLSRRKIKEKPQQKAELD